uniref:Serine hydroxymethyltransferase (GlyA, SHMT) n=1 Tax=uncultured marine thaumarchaeote SAT1000_10_C05 TaxID=1456372 RepID=A0A075I3S8_9ARCH|nr:serine hydroxymethyltransferase (glyA, SHMT) [uncultured marine thaumarchaeote SAT1000_10_C05]
MALSSFGFKVLGEKKGFTQSHQAVVNVLDYGDGGKIEADLEKANIIVNRQLIPGDLKAKRHYMHPGGIRLGSSEVTRLGMKESEMQQIALFIKQIVIDKKDVKEVVNQVTELRKITRKLSIVSTTNLVHMNM